MRTVLLSLMLVMLSAFGSACTDPCVALAERICRCEETPLARQSCEAQRIDPLQDRVQPTVEEQERCAEALDTCTCQALDENRVELCAFTREAEEE